MVTKMGVTLIVQITSKPGRGKELAQLLQPVPEDNDIDGCSGMDILKNSSNQDEIFIIEYWDSIQRHKSFLSELQDAGGLDKMLEMSETVSRKYFTETRQ